MTYNDALIAKDKNQHLIGQTDSTGFYTSTLLIVPSNPKSQERFIKDYIYKNVSDSQVEHYTDDNDFLLLALDLKQLEKHNMLFYDVIEK